MVSQLQCPAFAVADAPILAALSTAMKGSSTARSADAVVRSILDAKRELLTKYPEVALLDAIAHARRVAWDIAADIGQRNVTEGRCRQLSDKIRDIHNVLPDPVFAALADMTSHASAEPPEVCLRLLMEVLDVLNRVQSEVLRRSSSLTKRCEELTFSFRHTFPFCVTVDA